jgi:hypothetical protein
MARPGSRILLLVASLVVALAAASGRAMPAGVASPRYEEVKSWPRLPAGVQMGEAAGVAVDQGGHVFVFHRPGRGFDTSATELLEGAAVLEIDADTGQLINAWGARTFLVPHGITIDGENNVFLTDVALQQVFKFSRDGRLIFAVGEPRVGRWDATHFNQPTDIAIEPIGRSRVRRLRERRVARFGPERHVDGRVGKKGAGAASSATRTGSVSARRHRRGRRRPREFTAAAFDGTGAFKRQWVGAKDADRLQIQRCRDNAGAIASASAAPTTTRHRRGQARSRVEHRQCHRSAGPATRHQRRTTWPSTPMGRFMLLKRGRSEW